MKPEIKARWLAALRSGDYRQSQYRLREGDAYCCLGVLCDLVRREVGGEWLKATNALDGNDKTLWPDATENTYVFNAGQADSTGGMLPPVVAHYAGLDVNHLGVRILPHLMLTDMNDQGSNFAEIADSIEKHL
jgi:hypothetical protein